LYRASARRVRIEEYAADVVSRIAALADAREDIRMAEGRELARRLCGGFGPADEKVELVRCHGDFQPGNILYDNGKVWLIDWEFSTERQREYDLLTYSLGARFPKGLGRRITMYAGALRDGLQRRKLRLFLLESILFESEAATVAPSHYAPTSLTAKIAELEKALSSIEKDCKA
jgi:hypothetical protein